MKKAFILRGFSLGTSAADPDYSDVRDAVQAKGYEVVPFPMTWNNKTMSQYSGAFVDFYLENKGKENIVIGHSFGAVAAFISAVQTKPDLLILCSLSGYFKEDLDKYDHSTPTLKRMGSRRLADFKNLSADSIGSDIASEGIRSLMLYGEKEKELHPMLYNRVQQTAKILKPSKLVSIPDADHDIHSHPYLSALSQLI